MSVQLSYWDNPRNFTHLLEYSINLLLISIDSILITRSISGSYKA